MSNIDAGTGQPARPGVDASSPVTTQDWENWHQASGLGQRKPTLKAVYTAAAAQVPSRRRVATWVTGAAGVLAVFSAGVLYADLHSPHETAAAIPQVARPRAALAPTASTPSPKTTVVQVPAQVPVVIQPVGNLRAAPPVRISIPALKIDQRLIGLQVNANRQLEVPRHYTDIGWWSTGPAAGDPGAAVIVGHLDSMVGPAVFYRLSSLTRGDTIAVRRSDGTTVTFAVTRLQLFSKKHFPDKLVYRTTGTPSLNLLTCGGSYDRATGYRDNVVVFADLVKPRPAAKAKPKAAAHPKPPTKAEPAAKHTPRAAAKPKATGKPKAVVKRKAARAGTR